MTPGESTTVGFYGPGHASKAVVRRLIEFWYFADVSVIMPANPEHPMDPEVAEVIKEILGEYVYWETDVVDELKIAREDGDYVELAVAWDASVDDDTRSMVAQARREKIRVRNLCKGLYDLTEDEDGETSPQYPPEIPESHAKPVKVPRPCPRTPQPPEPAGDFTGTLEVTVAIDSAASARRWLKIFEENNFDAYAAIIRETFGMKHPGTTVHVHKNPHKEDTEMTASPKTRTYVSDGNGGWVPAGRGRPKAGVERVKLTDEEARERGIIE